MMEDLFIPITFFISLAVAVSIGLMFRFRARQEIQTTLRAAIEKGHELTPDLLASLGDAADPKMRDLRRGVVSIAIAIAFLALAFMIDEDEAIRPLIGVAAFPFMVGLAHLFLWRITGERS